MFCDQEETAQHILVGCVFAREFWFSLLSHFDLQRLTPGISEDSFALWWRRSSKQIAKGSKKGFNTLIILGAWILWKHRNAGVFDGTTPPVQGAMAILKQETQLWSLAGARGLTVGRLLRSP